MLVLTTDSDARKRVLAIIVMALMTCGALVGLSVKAPTAHADPAAVSQYFSVNPTNLVDTRDGTGGVPAAKVSAGSTITFQVAGVADIPASGVSAVVLNVTALSAEAYGWLNLYPSDAPVTTSTLTYQAGEDTTGEDFTQLTSTGQVSVKNNGGGATHLLVSVKGYFMDASASQAGGEYYPVESTYLYDTRPGHVTGSPTHDDTPIPANSSVTIDVAGQQGIPATGATAVAVNVAVTSQTQTGWLTAYPSDQPQPTSAVVDFVPGESDSSFAVLPLTSTGKITMTNRSSGTLHLLVSVRGYFLGAAAGDGLGYTPTPTTVLLDTLTGAGVPGGATQPVAAGATFTFNVVEAAGLAEGTASVMALNINGRRPTNQGWLSSYPSEDADPLTPSVNFDDGGESANGFDLVIPDSQGNISFTNHSGGTVHLQVSLRGYFTMPFEEEGEVAEEGSEVVDDQVGATATTPNRYFSASARRDPLHFYSAPPGGVSGRLYWAGSAPYDVYLNATVVDGSPDGYCIGTLVRMDGTVYWSRSWMDCGSNSTFKHVKGWFWRTATSVYFKACLFKHYANGWRYGYCTSSWK